ncbi:uncharacterized protein CTHT_0044410 [Thermochaetoides thermophila DSM 1495]|uniref:JmjC domain-containing protein n=1 Tax=Chaetomium thermophilum (strain DSM 1495 / CBS 144.50 / IMI 039719) TaxID=759272 RepID=G0S937_CHATD|nr:hypothetical protein CTHT_0044410 [Thermochaetoides thermophila DSM 1495]EGS19948.1 hypothetical protein CTHT_0044410 [Thermochaetoides thermophila DSM 1495]
MLVSSPFSRRLVANTGDVSQKVLRLIGPCIRRNFASDSSPPSGTISRGKYRFLDLLPREQEKWMTLRDLTSHNSKIAVVVIRANRNKKQQKASSTQPAIALPALSKWFTSSSGWIDFSATLEPHSECMVPYELLVPATVVEELPQDSPLATFLQWLAKQEQPLYQQLKDSLEYNINLGRLVPKADTETSKTRFIRFEAPLGLLLAALKFNKHQPSTTGRLNNLYVAQARIEFLPHELQSDLPVPEVITSNGDGDLYASSVWFGLQPTYTPLHRDPNDNIFVQLCGTKVFRIMAPLAGGRMFNKVCTDLGRETGNSRLRGIEMMEEPERTAFFEAVWGKQAPVTSIHEVVLHPGDAMYLRTGFWHSVRAVGKEGNLNASVNWWFRWRNINHSKVEEDGKNFKSQRHK